MSRPCRIGLLLLALLARPLRADVYAYVGEHGSLVLSNLEADRGRGTLLVADAANPETPAPAKSAYRAPRYRDEIEMAARESGLDAALLHAVIHVESAYSARAVSARGAIGLMQLMPLTAQRFGVADAYDPLQNIRGGARYLGYLLASFGGNVDLALAAYNAGENAVRRHGGRIPPYPETIEYVRKVQEVRCSRIRFCKPPPPPAQRPQ